jgi:O-antigen/teichoic acid export membrane protein
VGYFKRAARGVAWMGALRGSTRVIAYIRIAVLARLLTPAQFGIFGIASLALAFLEIITETGINIFLVQDEGDLDNYLDTAWLVSILRGLLISILILVFTPFIAAFFNSPEAKTILYLIAAVPFIRGFINPSLVKFQKELQFGKEFWFRFVTLSSHTVVAVTIGYLTRSATAFVYGLGVAAFLEVVLSFAFISPRPKIAFDKKKLKKVISRGKWVTAAGVFEYLFREGDDVVVGRLLDTDALGLYQVAYKIATLPVKEVGQVFNKVTFPIYTRIIKDKKRLRGAFLKTLLTISLLVIPFSLLLLFFAKPIVLFVLGEKWLPAVGVIKILAVFGAVRSISRSVNPLFLSVKKQEYMTITSLAGIVGMAVSIFPLILRFGIQGAGLAALIGALVSLPVMFLYSAKILKA